MLSPRNEQRAGPAAFRLNIPSLCRSLMGSPSALKLVAAAIMKLENVFGRAIALLLAAIVAATAAGPTPTRTERILQQEIKQQQIQRTTQRVADQLTSIINEFDRNGIVGEDVKVLRAIRMVLGRLSEREMAQVVTLLQQAQKTEN